MFLDTGNLFDNEIFLELKKTSEADPIKKRVPAYHFNICKLEDKVDVGFCNRLTDA